MKLTAQDILVLPQQPVLEIHFLKASLKVTSVYCVFFYLI